MAETSEQLYCYTSDKVATHVTKLQSLNVAIKVYVKHLCHDQVVLAEKEGIVYLEQSVPVRIAGQDFTQESSL